jgi:hypothetical protein
MTDFFQIESLVKEARLLKRQPWMGPPANVVGRAIALNILARTDVGAVAVPGAVAYPAGVQFDLVIFVSPVASIARDLLVRQPAFEAAARNSGTLPDELFRWGLEFENGSKTTSVDPLPPSADESGSAVHERPTVALLGGSIDVGRREERWWLSPLPPAGELAFVFEWPVIGIELTRIPFEADLLTLAGNETATLWQEADSSPTDDERESFSVSYDLAAEPDELS